MNRSLKIITIVALCLFLNCGVAEDFSSIFNAVRGNQSQIKILDNSPKIEVKKKNKPKIEVKKKNKKGRSPKKKNWSIKKNWSNNPCPSELDLSRRYNEGPPIMGYLFIIALGFFIISIFFGPITFLIGIGFIFLGLIHPVLWGIKAAGLLCTLDYSGMERVPILGWLYYALRYQEPWNAPFVILLGTFIGYLILGAIILFVVIKILDMLDG
jgi:hypothetical protein